MNRSMKRKMVKEKRNDLMKSISEFQQTVKKEAAKEALSIAKTISSLTISDIVIPSAIEVLKTEFSFSDDQINKFMEAFSKKSDELMTKKEEVNSAELANKA
jgi:predicted nucleic acid-binding protein